MPEGETPASTSEALMEVLIDRLAPPSRSEESTAPALARVEILRLLGARRATRRRRVPKQLDPDIAAMFGLVAPRPENLEQLTPEIAEMVERSLQEGLSREETPAVFQAYVRAVSRVVAAEVTSIHHVLADTPPDQQAERLDHILGLLLPVGSGGFDLMRRMMLLDALTDEVAEIGEPTPDRDVMAVAMIDLVGSTRYLSTAPPADLELLVDALFAAGQSATRQHSVFVMKYVGDGVFLAGRDTAEVADVALDVIARLEATLPLRARGGLAAGTVVQRAGDLFGLPVNVAHVVTKASRPGRLLATQDAAAQLPASRRGRYRVVDLPHPALQETRVATIRPASGHEH